MEQSIIYIARLTVDNVGRAWCDYDVVNEMGTSMVGQFAVPYGFN